MTPPIAAQPLMLQRAILSVAAVLVARAERAEWLAEWNAELWHARKAGYWKSIAFCLGAFQDALWLRRNRLPFSVPAPPQLSPPLRCISLLALLAAASVFAALYTPGYRGGGAVIRERLFSSPGSSYHLAHYLVMLIALIVLPATTQLALGDYPAGRSSRWFFLAIKLALLVVMVFFGSQTLASFLPPIEGQVALIGYMLAFRWALIDQRRRCPVCLRLLTNPTPIGAPSQTFLAWYGTELICLRGHGLLYVTEIPTSCASVQRWQSLDRSWSGLFPNA